MDDLITVNHKILKSARTAINMSLEHVAKKDNIPAKQLLAWELGIRKPKMSELKTLVDRYRYHLVDFFSPDGRSIEVLPDLRKEPIPLDPACYFLLHHIMSNQTWLANYYEQEDVYEEELENKFVDQCPYGTYHLEKLYDALQLNSEDDLHSPKDIYFWIDRVQSKLSYNVSIAGGIDDEYRIDPKILTGFAIADKIAPWIYINSYYGIDQKLSFQSLMYGVAQIFLGESGITNFLYNADRHNQTVLIGSDRKLDYVAKQLILKLPFDKNGNTEHTPLERNILLNSKRFVQVVLSAYYNDHVYGSEASDLLLCKINHFEELSYLTSLKVRKQT